MKSLLLSGACAASILLAVTSSAQAADFEAAPEPAGMGWYVSVFGGWSHPIDDLDIDFSTGVGGATPTANFNSIEAEIDIDNGFLAGLALGAQFGSWARGEIEISGHWHDAEGTATLAYAVPGTGTLPISTGTDTDEISGDVNALFLLANLWIDVPVGEVIRPYVGGGVGLGRLDVDVTTDDDDAEIDDADWAFAYQLGAGIGFDVTEALTLDVGYRYKVIHNAELEGTVSGDDFEIETDYKSHNVLLGLRFGF